MRCHIRKRGYRSWSIVIDLDRDANGKRRQKWITVKGTKRDAERKAAEISSSRRCTEFMGGGDSCSPAPMGNRCYRGRLATPSSRSPARRAFPTYGSTISDTRTPRLCYSRAVHLKVVQERLGHATISTTSDIYSHLLPGIQEAAAARFDDEISGV